MTNEEKCLEQRPTFKVTVQSKFNPLRMRITATWQNPSHQQCASCIEYLPGEEPARSARFREQLMISCLDMMKGLG